MSISRDRVSWCGCHDDPRPHVAVDGECIHRRTERESKRLLKEIVKQLAEAS